MSARNLILAVGASVLLAVVLNALWSGAMSIESASIWSNVYGSKPKEVFELSDCALGVYILGQLLAWTPVLLMFVMLATIVGNRDVAFYPRLAWTLRIARRYLVVGIVGGFVFATKMLLASMGESGISLYDFALRYSPTALIYVLFPTIGLLGLFDVLRWIVGRIIERITNRSIYFGRTA